MRQTSLLKLAIVSGMPFYWYEGYYYMSHLSDVLKQIARYFDTVTYVGLNGNADPVDIRHFSRVEAPNVRLCTMAPGDWSWIKIGMLAPWRLWQIVRAIRDSDVVLAKLSGYYGVLGALAGRLARKKVITYLITDPSFQPSGSNVLVRRAKSYIRERIWSTVYRNGDLRLYIAPIWAKKYLNPSRANDTWYVEASLWPDERHIIRVREPKGVSTVLFVGRVTFDKGLADLLYAAKFLVERGQSFVVHIVGTGPDRARLEHLAAQLGIDDRIRFSGFVPQGEQLWRIYESADLFVLPSHSEALGLVLLEAMSRGLPIVATKVGGIPDLIEHGVNGFLVPLHAPKQLAGAIEQLLRDSDLRSRMSAANLSKVKAFYTPKQTEQLCRAIYGLFGMELPVMRRDE
jgi:glycosyltransferase involved in cell wall biosynthesis